MCVCVAHCNSDQKVSFLQQERVYVRVCRRSCSHRLRDVFSAWRAVTEFATRQRDVETARIIQVKGLRQFKRAIERARVSHTRAHTHAHTRTYSSGLACESTTIWAVRPVVCVCFFCCGPSILHVCGGVHRPPGTSSYLYLLIYINVCVYVAMCQ